MDELKAMRTFVGVVDAGSFAGAARAMDLAPPVVTRTIAELERHLGVRLMARTTRRLALTDVGARYLERVRVIVHAAAEAAALARQAQSEPSGRLRVLAPPAFAAQQLAQRLPRFHRQHPQVTVEVAPAAARQGVDAAHDITILVQQPAPDGDFVARRLARSALVACAAPEYLDRHGRPRHPQDLAAHPLLLPAAGAAARGLTFHPPGADGASVTVTPPHARLACPSPELQQAAALAGIGIARLPSFLVEQDLRAHRLEQVLPGWRLPQLSVFACLPTGRHLPASTRAFMDFLVAEFGGRDVDPWLGAAARAA